VRSTIRARANRIFVSYPAIGRLGYGFLRVSGLDRSTRGVKDFFRNLARRGFSPGVIADIGANHGGWSREVHTVYPRARFYLIEPQEEMRPFLDQFIATAEGSDWFLGGAGATEGELEMTLWEDLQGSAFLSPEIRNLVPDRQQRTVPVFTIDSLITDGKMPLPGLVKIDVQGYELQVLEGCLNCLGTTEMFIIETSFLHPLGQRPNYYHVVELMEAHDYQIFDLVDLKYRPGDDALWQADVCFVHKESFLIGPISGNNHQMGNKQK
jgi:FkbM family methyltransferase